MKKVFCDACQKQVNYEVIKKEIREYKGVEVNHIDYIGVCKECGNEIFVEELETDNLDRLYKKYRKLTNMVTPEDIISFRDKYNISQRDLVGILGWGKMTINRYERGSLASKSHNDLLKIIINDDNKFFDKVKEAYENDRITEKKYKVLINKEKDILQDCIKGYIENQLDHKEDIYNGFRRFDIYKTENLISYLALRLSGIYKTQLNKLLFYIDFANFKDNLRSVTGLRYIKYTYGPVIENHMYNEIIFSLRDKFFLEEREFDEKTTTLIKSLGNYNLDDFNNNELEIIDKVINRLKGVSSKDISLLSHKEKAWIDNKENDLISYEKAEELNLF